MAVAVHFFFVNLLHTETIANDVGHSGKECTVRVHGGWNAVFDGLQHNVVENALHRSLRNQRFGTDDSARQNQETRFNAKGKDTPTAIVEGPWGNIVRIIILGNILFVCAVANRKRGGQGPKA